MNSLPTSSLVFGVTKNTANAARSFFKKVKDAAVAGSKAATKAAKEDWKS